MLEAAGFLHEYSCGCALDWVSGTPANSIGKLFKFGPCCEAYLNNMQHHGHGCSTWQGLNLGTDGETENEIPDS